jgi:DNA processing protein
MNLIYYYWLSTTNGIGNKRISDIISYFGDVKSAWRARREEFFKIGGISQSIADNIVIRRDERKLLEEIEDIKKKYINIITIDDDEYPYNLKNIYDPPYIIYLKGKMKKCKKYIAVVGSRNCTSYGKMVARNISNLLSKYDFGIISGMARGIDTQAHLGVLDAGGFTCAVLGSGCDIVYPPENIKIMYEIEKKGAIISEYLPGTKPAAYNFPTRNRIISGISDGVLVIEAGEKSGALITVNFALEQGKDVFAIPGSVLSKSSKGTNLLIKDGAKIVTDIYDILNEYKIDFNIEENNNYNEEITSKEKIIMGVINDSPIYIDDLIKRVKLGISEVNSILTILEVKNIIKILPGKYIVRTF